MPEARLKRTREVNKDYNYAPPTFERKCMWCSIPTDKNLCDKCFESIEDAEDREAVFLSMRERGVNITWEQLKKDLNW